MNIEVMDYMDRPPSDHMVDIHVYVVPTEYWREHLNSAVNQIINETVSAGFIRVYPEITLRALRQEIAEQLGEGILPIDYTFLRSVGRCLTRVQAKQEYQLKAKNFVPPQAYAPEIFVLEGVPDDRSSVGLASSQRSLNRRNQTSSDTVRSYHSNKSDFSPHKPIPPIQNSAFASTQTGAGYGQTEVPRLALNNGSPYPNIPQPDYLQPYQHPQAYLDQRYPSPHHRPQSNRQPYSNSPYGGQPYPSKEHPIQYPKQLHPSKAQHLNQPPYRVEPYTQKASSYERHTGSPRHSHNVAPTAREPTRPPLSASPPAYLDENNYDNRPLDEERTESPGVLVEGEAGPPLSATPPGSAQLQRQKFTSHDSGISEIDDLEKKQQDSRQQQDEEGRYQEKGDTLQEQETNEQEDEQEEQDEDQTDEHDEEDKDKQGLDPDRWQDEDKQDGNGDDEEGRWEQQDDVTDETGKEENEDGKEENNVDNEEEDSKDDDIEPPPPSVLQDYEGSRPGSQSQNPNYNKEKAKLLNELRKVQYQRKDVEKKREELVRRAKQLQAKTHQRRSQARDVWKKKYFEEKKKTPPLEEQVGRLRNELDNLHQRIMSHLEGSREKDAALQRIDQPSGQKNKKNNLKLQATKAAHDIEDLQRRVEDVKMKLTGEIKLRKQAETEVKALKAELTQKKINLTLTRSQQLSTYNNATEGVSPRPPAITAR